MFVYLRLLLLQESWVTLDVLLPRQQKKAQPCGKAEMEVISCYNSENASRKNDN